MLHGKPVLIVEDEAIIAIGLAAAVREAGGTVIGPVPTVAMAFSLLDQHSIAAAILDANLADRDVTPLALELSLQGVPFIVQTGKGLPEELAEVMPDVPVIMKPAASGAIVASLIAEIAIMIGPEAA